MTIYDELAGDGSGSSRTVVVTYTDDTTDTFTNCGNVIIKDGFIQFPGELGTEGEKGHHIAIASIKKFTIEIVA